jgi:hypothetical protein
MLSIHTTLAITFTVAITWALAAFFALSGLCNADPFGEYQSHVYEPPIIELKMDGPRMPSIKLGPPNDIEANA